MKRTSCGIAVLVLLLAAVSCKSTGPSRKYAGMVADMDPILMQDNLTAEFKKTFSGIQKKNVKAFFRPRANVVSLEFSYELVQYKQLWSPDGQAAFTSALARYKEDFNSRSLNPKGAGRAYGKFKGVVEWASTDLSISFVSSSQPQFDLGYEFKDGSPYFRVLMRPAPADKKMVNDVQLFSQEIPMYFTIGQAEAVTALFDEKKQLALLGPKGEDGYYQAEMDEYNAKQEAGVLGGVKKWAGDLAEDATGTNPFKNDKPVSGGEGDSYGSQPAPAQTDSPQPAPENPAPPAD